jgi:hypothetical protein
MSTLDTSGAFKERLPYLLMALFFTFAITFCIINTYEFVKLLHNDPNDDLEVSHSYTWFLIVFNGIFAVLFLFLLIMSVWLAINPRGDNWVRKLLGKLKIYKTASIDFSKDQQQNIINSYNPKITVSKSSIEQTLRGPKITYTCPKDRETPIPVMVEPIKRITLGDFEPYDSKKNMNVAPMAKHPLTLDNLKELYLSRKK